MADLVTFEELKDYHCRWIENDDMRNPQYCGCQVVSGHSWCRAHFDRVYPPRNLRAVENADAPIVRNRKAFGRITVRG